MIQSRKLANGLKVHLIENHKSPVVSVQMWVKTGSADERKGEEGLSHFIEHLVFKGTEKYGVGEIASSVEAAGGELNAWTSFDQTVFYVNISNAEVDLALSVVSQLTGFPIFDTKELNLEREVVREEIKRANDNPGRLANQLLFSTVYQKHPYRVPVIGFDKVISKVSRKKITDYFDHRYVPRNMDLIIAGDFKNKEMFSRVSKFFAPMKNRSLRPARRVLEPAQLKTRLTVDEAPLQEGRFHWAWPVPGPKHKDVPALEVLAFILGQGESSRLTRVLRIESALVNSVGAGTFIPKDGGFFSISGTLNVENSKAALEKMAFEVTQICSEPPKADELEKAKTCFEADEIYSAETIEGLARKAGSLQNLVGDPKYSEKFLAQVRRLDAGQILKAARKYLDPKKLNAVFIAPKGMQDAAEKEMQTAVEQFKVDFKKISKKPVKIAKAKKAPVRAKAGRRAAAKASKEDQIMRTQTKHGLTIVHRRNISTPLFNVRIGFLGGLRIENTTSNGVTELLSRVWTAGAGDMNEIDMQSFIDGKAAGISAFSGRNMVGLSLSGLTKVEGDLANIFRDLLSKPHLPQTAIDREKTIMKEVLKTRKDHPQRIASRAFMEEIFKGHPYGLDPFGSEESLNRLDRKVVSQFLAEVTTKKNLTISLAGDFDIDLWKGALENGTEAFLEGQALNQPIIAPPIHAGVKKYIEMQKEQTHIMLGYRGIKVTDPRRHALHLANAILSGMGGRLFVELREKASLAYSVSPMQLEGLDAGYFGAYIACSAEKGQLAIEMMMNELQKLANHAPEPSELQRAKRLISGRHDLDLQRTNSICESMMLNEAYGLSAEETFDFRQHINSVTADEVSTCVKELISTPQILVAVGATCPWS